MFKRLLLPREPRRPGDLRYEPETGQYTPVVGRTDNDDTDVVIRPSPWPYLQLYADTHYTTDVFGGRDGTHGRPFVNLTTAKQAVIQMGNCWYQILDLRGIQLEARDPPVILPPIGYTPLQPGTPWQDDVLVSSWDDGCHWAYPDDSDPPLTGIWNYNSASIACRPIPPKRPPG